MRKLGKKISFLTKIMLVIGLLISNLSSLSVVFAYEVLEDVVVTLNEEVLEISYNEELTEEVEAVDVRVYENYSFLDGESIEEVVTNYSLGEEELLEALEGNLKLEINSIFALEEDVISEYKLFDGSYSVKVEIVDVTVYEDSLEEDENTEALVLDTTVLVEEPELKNTETEVLETVLAYGSYEEKFNHEQGLGIRLYNLSDNSEIELVDGKYQVNAESSKVSVVAQILSGGLNPSDVFEVDDEQYTAYELLQKGFSEEVEFAGRLFGEYNVPVSVGVVKVLPQIEVSETTELVDTDVLETGEEDNGTYEEIIYTDAINVMYGSYDLNDNVLNSAALSEGYSDAYLFYSDSKDGRLYVLSEFEEVIALSIEEDVVTRTMLDVYNMLQVAFGSEEDVEQTITYKLLKNGEDVLEGYVPSSEEDTIENYLATMTLDDTVVVELSNEGLTVSYRVVVAGDLDNDSLLTENDVLELIDQFVGESEVADIYKSDVYRFDGEVTSFDVLYLNQVVQNKDWATMIMAEEVNLDASLEVSANGEALSEENYLTSGDEFTVDYVLSLSDYDVNGVAGLFDYDKNLFELLNVKVNYDWLGNVKDGRFLYLGEESLTAPELSEEETETEITENEEVEAVFVEETEEDTSLDYVVISATFRALRATEEGNDNVIRLNDIELFNSTIDGVIYYILDNDELFTESISVVASEDNSLSYLEVAGVEITLEDGVYEYEVTVSNDVTVVDLKYILGNVAASVTSEIYPEELVEGNNTVVVTVVSESGVSQDYTITVIREETPETTTQVNYNNYDNNYDNDDSTGGVVVTPGNTDNLDEDDVEEEDSDLSRIIIIILILIVIAGLVYLIFKDDDEETKKANKEIDKLKKEKVEPEVKEQLKKVEEKNTKKTSDSKTNTKTNNTSKNKNTKSKSKNNKKER